MRSFHHHLLIPLTLLHHAQALRSLEDGITAIPFLPTVVPLAVRSPYLGTYLQGGEDKDLSEMSPSFWTGTPIGWTGLVRVDGSTVENWMGNLTDWPAANNTGFKLTASSSNFTYTLANLTVRLHVSFLSPITPHDIFRQSLPLSYLTITAESLDGRPHQVEVYTDVNGLWCHDSEDAMIGATYHLNHSGNWQTLRFHLQDQQTFVESDDRILHGSLWYSTIGNAQVTRSSGRDAKRTRTLFVETGRLDHHDNETHRPIITRSGINDEPVLAFAHIFGTVGPRTPLERRSAIISIGHIREPSVQYMTSGDHIVELQPLWKSRFTSPLEMIGFHLEDYHYSRTESEAWDAKLESDARRVHSSGYADLLAISSRQIYMALEAVWDEVSLGNSTAQTTDTMVGGTRAMVMLKEISSNGNCQTTDVIAPMLPFLIYASPELIPLLLEPIYKYISTGLYQPIPTPHDLGDHYPNATGRNDYTESNLPLEESGNFICLALACVRLGTCKVQAKNYYAILKQWADWLVENALYPDDQRSTDDFFGPSPNQTSLAVKGILGLRAMSEISLELGKDEDSLYFKDVASRYVKTLLAIAVAEDRSHIMGSYGNESSWSTQYNLFLDTVFEFNLFPDWVYEMQDRWYVLKAGGNETFGPPLDSRSPDRAKTDWLVWAAAASRSNETCSRLLGSVIRYVRQTSNMVFGDLIRVDGGWSIGFLVRPVVGGHFALLAHAPPPGSKPSFVTFFVIGLGTISIGFVIWRRWCGRTMRPGSGGGRDGKGRRSSDSSTGSIGFSSDSRRKDRRGRNKHGDEEDELEIELLRPVPYNHDDPSISSDATPA